MQMSPFPKDSSAAIPIPAVSKDEQQSEKHRCACVVNHFLTLPFLYRNILIGLVSLLVSIDDMFTFIMNPQSVVLNEVNRDIFA